MRYTLIVLGVAVVVLIIGGVMVLSGATGGGAEASPTPTPTPTITQQAVSKDLQITDITVGTGAEAVAGKKISVNYVGTLADGTKFDSSYDRNQPFEFTLGAGQVIAGWDQGVAGMKVGGKRKLVIPPSLGYGSQANGSIPANSTLTFEVELLAVK
jgi:FKBP-type peptidyl-prolyl cis-trans isomerase